MLPFSNTLCTVEISGALLETTLAHGVAEPGRPAGRFPQISGASFRVVGPGKIADLKVNGKPVQPDRTYVLALTDYTLSGGDDYDMLKRGNVLVSPEEGELLVTAIAEYLSQAGTVAPVVENRIRFAP
jgi:2',3'-cyclic-nucleotide 2'-phosphodiesterase (5'-nucleotidase family)